MKISQLVTIALICWYFIVRHYLWKFFLVVHNRPEKVDVVFSYVVAFPVSVVSAMLLIALGLGLGGYFG